MPTITFDTEAPRTDDERLLFVEDARLPHDAGLDDDGNRESARELCDEQIYAGLIAPY